LGQPVFVTGIDPVTNRITLSPAGEDIIRAVTVSALTTPTGQPLPPEFRTGVKLRSVAKPVPATVVCDGAGAEIRLDEPHRVVASGQSAVFYDGDVLLGGGIIERCE
jgi:tRNA-specific 2-thiouridylase